MVRRLLAVFFVLSVLNVSGVDAQGTASYTITDLIQAHESPFSAEFGIGAYALNLDGTVVGFTGSDDGRSRPFVYADGKATRLAAPQEWGATASDINADGVIVGRMRTAEMASGAFQGVPVKWVDGEMIELEIPASPFGGAFVSGVARAINDAGTIAGDITYENNSSVAVIWDTTGVRTLPTLDAPVCNAWAITETGLVGGSCSLTTAWTPVIWEGETMTPLLPAGIFTDPSVELRDLINTEAGGSAGVMLALDDPFVPTYLHAVQLVDNVAATLPAPDGKPNCLPFSIAETADGLLVGGYCTDEIPGILPDWPRAEATAWLDGELLPLSELVGDPDWTLMSIRSVNSNGQLVGFGEHNGERRAFLLDPI